VEGNFDLLAFTYVSYEIAFARMIFSSYFLEARSMHKSMDSARAQERRRGWRFSGIAVLLAVFAAPLAAQAGTLQANPKDVVAQLLKLQPGDTLVLQPGIFEPLQLSELNG
jgi:hypothetical protein